MKAARTTRRASGWKGECVIAVASSVLVLLLLTPGAVVAKSKGEAAPGSPEATTRLLKNRTARIYLTSGEVVAEAKQVEVNQCSVSWQLGGQLREVPSGEVQSITALKKSRGMRGLAIGAGIGAGLGAMSMGQADSGGYEDSPLGAGAFALSVLVAAPVGWGIGTLAKQPEQEVYSASTSRDGPGAGAPCPPAVGGK